MAGKQLVVVKSVEDAELIAENKVGDHVVCSCEMMLNKLGYPQRMRAYVCQ